jgi:serine/threonine protein kinase
MDYLFETIFKHSNRQFKYLQDLGKGVFGNVFLVASSRGEKFALKVINLEKMDNGSTQKVMKEVEILAQLKHKNILDYKGHFYVKNKCLCIFTSYCEGGSLTVNL